MKQIYRFRTKIEGTVLYTLNENEKHPYMKNEYPYPVKMTKKNIMSYLLDRQEDQIYNVTNVTELRRKKKEELLKMI